MSIGNSEHRFIYLCGCVIAVLLVLMVFIPLGNDLVVFDLGGSLIFRHGAIPYRDFLDMKQPLIYYIFGFASFVFGHHEASIRILDTIYHAVSLILFYRFLKTVGYTAVTAIISVLCYALYYAGSIGPAGTESFALFPQILIVMLLLRQTASGGENSWKSGLMIGTLLIILCLLKVTFLFFALAVFPFSFLFIPRKKALVLSVSAAGTFIFLGGTYIVWLSVTDGLRNTIAVMGWLNHYASIVPLISIQTFKIFYYKFLPSQFLLTFAPSFTILFFIGLINKPLRLFTGQTTLDRFRLLCFMSIIAGLIGIAVERKAFNYHFTRIAWCVVPFVAEGITDASSSVCRWFQNISGSAILQKAAVTAGTAVLLILLILFSPIPRVIDQPIGWTILHFQNDISAVNEKLDERDNTEIRKIALKYRSSLPSNASIFLWGNTARTYYEFDRLPTTLCIVNPEFVSPWTPSEWIDTLILQLSKAPPAVFVCQKNDARFGINGTMDDSYHSLMRLPALWTFLSKDYKLEDSSEHFYLYLKR